MGTRNLRIGCGKLDRDHEVLIDLIARLTAALETKRMERESEGLAINLEAYFDAHFENEEDLMAKSHYPDLERHKAEHDRLRAQYRDLVATVRGGDCGNAGELLRLLATWLHQHVDGTDRPLAQHLVRCGMAE